MFIYNLKMEMIPLGMHLCMHKASATKMIKGRLKETLLRHTKVDGLTFAISANFF
jgi:hypothetical protein